MASFCPIFLPIFKDAKGRKSGFGSDLEKTKEGVVSKGKNEYG